MSEKPELDMSKISSALYHKLHKAPLTDEFNSKSHVIVFKTNTTLSVLKDGSCLDANGNPISGIKVRMTIASDSEGGLYTATADLYGIGKLSKDPRIVSIG